MTSKAGDRSVAATTWQFRLHLAWIMHAASFVGTLIWAGTFNLVLLRSLNVTLGWEDGIPMRLSMAVFIEVLGAFPGVALVWCTLFVISHLLRMRCCAWLVLLWTIVIGTPVVFPIARSLARYLWE